jgi:hypothetical protein
MTENEYKTNLLALIAEFRASKMSSIDFAKKGQALGEEVDKSGPRGYMSLSDFEEEELGWAKYWFEEMNYYGIDEVLKNYFHYFEYYDSQKTSLN